MHWFQSWELQLFPDFTAFFRCRIFPASRHHYCSSIMKGGNPVLQEQFHSVASQMEQKSIRKCLYFVNVIYLRVNNWASITPYEFYLEFEIIQEHLQDIYNQQITNCKITLGPNYKSLAPGNTILIGNFQAFVPHPHCLVKFPFFKLFPI